jgi:hypothetical protein
VKIKYVSGKLALSMKINLSIISFVELISSISVISKKSATPEFSMNCPLIYAFFFSID